MPRLCLLALGHQSRPVLLDETTYVVVPAEEAFPPSLGHSQVVEREVDNVNPAGNIRTKALTLCPGHLACCWLRNITEGLNAVMGALSVVGCANEHSSN